MTTPIAERVAGPSHGRALSGDLSPVAIRRLTPHHRMAAVPLLKPQPATRRPHRRLPGVRRHLLLQAVET